MGHKLQIAIDQVKQVHRDMPTCANKFILQDAIDKLEALKNDERMKVEQCGYYNSSECDCIGEYCGSPN